MPVTTRPVTTRPAIKRRRTVAKDRPIHGMSITPFTPRGALDEPALRRHLRYMADGGVAVYLGAFTSGEGHLLTPKETRRLYEIGADELGGSCPVYAARLGYNDTATIIKEAKEAAAIGLDAAMIYPPAPGDPGAAVTPKEVERFFRDILEAVPTGVFLSLHSGKAPGVQIPVDLVGKLAEEYDQIHGIHVYNPSLTYVMQVVQAAQQHTPVRSAGSMQLLDTLAFGGAGFISLEPNIAPRLCCAVEQAYREGKHAEASAQFQRLLGLGALLGKHLPPRSLKASLNILGFSAGVCRKPYLPLEQASLDDLARGLQALSVRKSERLPQAVP